MVVMEAPGAISAREYETILRSHRAIVTGIQEIEIKGLEVGRHMVNVHDYHWHEVLGYPTWLAYVASPEIHTSVQHSYRLMAVARASLGDGQAADAAPPLIPPAVAAAAGVTKTEMILPRVRRHPEEATHWGQLAEELTVGDLHLAIRQAEEPELTQLAEAADEWGRKLVAIAYRVRRTEDPLGALDELIAQAFAAQAYLAQLVPTMHPAGCDAPVTHRACER